MLSPGTVLGSYQILSALGAGEGEDVSDTLAAILRGEPDWNALPPDVPPHVRRIAERCLRRDRKARIPDFAVVRYSLDEPDLHGSSPQAAAADTPPQRTAGIRALRIWQAATALLALTIAGGGALWYRSSESTAPVTRFHITPPEQHSFDVAARAAAAAAISPDGLARRQAHRGARA